MNIDHAKLESLAREICDSRNGAGHYDKSGTHRSHWRELALVEITQADPLGFVESALVLFGVAA
jgi:hypothetical protein